jgi:hypothetical protein
MSRVLASEISAIGLLLALGGGAFAFGCGGNQGTVAVTPTKSQRATTEEIDANPAHVLPSGLVGYASLDITALLASPFGPRLLQVLSRLAPVSPDVGYKPERDLKQLYLGAYSMQGADLIAVAVGSFDAAALERSCAAGSPTPMGVAFTRIDYAGATIYSARDVGVTVLTPKVAIVGNPTALRRTLDRLEQGTLERAVPTWVERLQTSQDAPIVVAVDLAARAETDAVRRQIPLLDGVEVLQIVGNFADPGLNLAGTSAYSDDAAASRGADQLRAQTAALQMYGSLLALLGIQQPLRVVEAKAEGKNMRFVVGIDGRLVEQALGQLIHLLPQR